MGCFILYSQYPQNHGQITIRSGPISVLSCIVNKHVKSVLNTFHILYVFGPILFWSFVRYLFHIWGETWIKID